MLFPKDPVDHWIVTLKVYGDAGRVALRISNLQSMVPLKTASVLMQSGPNEFDPRTRVTLKGVFGGALPVAFTCTS